MDFASHSDVGTISQCAWISTSIITYWVITQKLINILIACIFPEMCRKRMFPLFGSTEFRCWQISWFVFGVCVCVAWLWSVHSVGRETQWYVWRGETCLLGQKWASLLKQIITVPKSTFVPWNAPPEPKITISMPTWWAGVLLSWRISAWLTAIQTCIL